MTTRPQTLLTWLFAGGLLGASGCSDAPTETVVATAAAKPTPFQAAADQAKAITEATQQVAATKPAEAVAPSKPKASAYEPPFPDRLDPFQAPKHGARIARQTTGDSAESVVLLGFANLGTPRAVLSIDQIVRPISQGEEVAGVTVISISPPQAVLQRGRSRWTASIE